MPCPPCSLCPHGEDGRARAAVTAAAVLSRRVARRARRVGRAPLQTGPPAAWASTASTTRPDAPPCSRPAAASCCLLLVLLVLRRTHAAELPTSSIARPPCPAIGSPSLPSPRSPVVLACLSIAGCVGSCWVVSPSRVAFPCRLPSCRVLSVPYSLPHRPHEKPDILLILRIAARIAYCRCISVQARGEMLQ